MRWGRVTWASMVDVDDNANPNGDNPIGANPIGAGPNGANPNDLAADEQRLAELATELADGVAAALGPWVVRCVERLCMAWEGEFPPSVRDQAQAAGDRATGEVGSKVRALLMSDVDAQRMNPLQLLRAAASYPTGVLQGAGVPPVVRDAEAERQFPDDDYDLTPASFADLDPALHDAGIAWGAGKAHVVLARRRAEGRR